MDTILVERRLGLLPGGSARGLEGALNVKRETSGIEASSSTFDLGITRKYVGETDRAWVCVGRQSFVGVRYSY